MTKSNDLERLVRWQPELSDVGKAHLEQLRRDIAPQITFVRQVRSALGLTQKGMAELLGMTQSAVSKLEARDDASITTLSKIAQSQGKRLRLVIESDDGEDLNVVVPAAA